jgi:hypothetical protein
MFVRGIGANRGETPSCDYDAGGFLWEVLRAAVCGLTEQIKANCVPVTPLNAAELREAITKPAELVGLKVEPNWCSG